MVSLGRLIEEALYHNLDLSNAEKRHYSLYCIFVLFFVYNIADATHSIKFGFRTTNGQHL